jgi:hypothetical protein
MSYELMVNSEKVKSQFKNPEGLDKVNLKI